VGEEKQSRRDANEVFEAIVDLVLYLKSDGHKDQTDIQNAIEFEGKRAKFIDALAPVFLARNKRT
jgi:hypothetical protein